MGLQGPRLNGGEGSRAEKSAGLEGESMGLAPDMRGRRRESGTTPHLPAGLWGGHQHAHRISDRRLGTGCWGNTTLFAGELNWRRKVTAQGECVKDVSGTGVEESHRLKL